MRKVTLRDEDDGRDRRFLDAYLDDAGNLHIEGQDLGPSTWPMSGDGEYEWRRIIKAQDVPHLLTLLGAPPGANVLDVLEEHWSGKRAGDLEALIGTSDIPVDFSSWSG
jgi:hypothetical protein